MIKFIVFITRTSKVFYTWCNQFLVVWPNQGETANQLRSGRNKMFNSIFGFAWFWYQPLQNPYLHVWSINQYFEQWKHSVNDTIRNPEWEAIVLNNTWLSFLTPIYPNGSHPIRLVEQWSQMKVVMVPYCVLPILDALLPSLVLWLCFDCMGDENAILGIMTMSLNWVTKYKSCNVITV